ncbi:MAG: nucleotidyltransferase family protein [Thermoguttaceae bacterium]
MECTAGLIPCEMKILTDFLAQFEEIEEARIFGSRAMGSYKKGSDIDIALLGENVTLKTARDFKFEVEEESCIPYFIDAVSYADIKNAELRSHIDRVAITVYRRATV